MFQEYYKCGLPCGPVVKNPLCNAGDTGLIPGWGTKIPGVAEQLSLNATTPEACVLWSPLDTTRVSHNTTKAQCHQISK